MKSQFKPLIKTGDFQLLVICVDEEVPIVSGGSVKPDNAKELLHQPDIDGALVGGACLKADSFAAIVQVAV